MSKEDRVKTETIQANLLEAFSRGLCTGPIPAKFLENYLRGVCGPFADVNKLDPEQIKCEVERRKELGNCFFIAGHYAEAASAYIAALSLDPTHKVSTSNLAQAFIETKNYREAINVAAKAIELDRANWKGYARLAKALFAVGEISEAQLVISAGLKTVQNQRALKDSIQKIFFAEDNPRKPTKSKVEKKGNLNLKTQAGKNLEQKENLPDEKSEEDNNKTMDETKDTSRKEKRSEASKDSGSKKNDRIKPVDFKDIESDELLSLATETSRQKYSDQRSQFDNLLKNGFAEANNMAYSKALDCYKKAFKIIENIPLKFLGLPDKELPALQYVTNLIKIKTNNYEKLVEAINDLKLIKENGGFIILPAFFYNKGLAYFKLNRFKAAIEELLKCEEIISRCFPYSKHCWPLTDVIIKETTKDGLQEVLNGLLEQAKSCNQSVPTAVCRFSECHKVSTHILPSEHIFISDLDFIGYVTVTCEEKCRIQYHLQCWKVYREKLSEFEKIADKDMLNKPCPTTDCLNSAGGQSKIVLVEKFGQDGNIKTQMKMDTTVSASKAVSKKRKRKEDCKFMEEKRDKEKADAKARRRTKTKSQSDKPIRNQVKSSKKDSVSDEILNEAIVHLINLRAVDFGFSSTTSWQISEAYYGRPDEKENALRFKMDKIENPLFVPNRDDALQMRFFKLLKREVSLPIESTEEYWNDEDEFPSEIRDYLEDEGIILYLLKSTLFSMIDDIVCISENLADAYREAEESLEESVSFMIANFTQSKAKSVSETPMTWNNSPSDSDSFMSDQSSDDESFADEEEERDNESHTLSSSDGGRESLEVLLSDDEIEDGVYQSDDQEDSESESADVPMNDDPVVLEANMNTEVSIVSSEKQLDAVHEMIGNTGSHADIEKAFSERSVQTDTIEESPKKDVIDNFEKEIELFKVKLTENEGKMNTLETEVSKLTSLNQKLEKEKAKSIEQREKLNRKFLAQSALFQKVQKKETALVEENEQLKKKVEKLGENSQDSLENHQRVVAEMRDSKIKVELALCNVEKDKIQLKSDFAKRQLKATELMLEQLGKKCKDTITDLKYLMTRNLPGHDRIIDALTEWTRFSFELNQVKKKLSSKLGSCDFDELIDSIQSAEPAHAQLSRFFQEEVSAASFKFKSHSSESESVGAASSSFYNDSKPMNAQTGPRKREEPHQGGDGVKEIAVTVNSVRANIPPTFPVRKRAYLSLKEKLRIRFPQRTEAELEECLRTVRTRNDDTLTGLRIDEIQHRICKILEEKSPSMGLEKFGEGGWCRNQTTEINWSGNAELEECIICSEEIDQKHCTTLNCCHYFHTECIRKWLEEKSVCPLCARFSKMPDEYPAL